MLLHQPYYHHLRECGNKEPNYYVTLGETYWLGDDHSSRIESRDCNRQRYLLGAIANIALAVVTSLLSSVTRS